MSVRQGFCSVVLLAAGALLAAEPQRTFHASPAGSDENPGTKAKPFRSMAGARDAVRKIHADMTGDIVVLLRGGTYAIKEAILFEAGDSGTNGHNIVYKAYPGETAVISGGRPITGWTQDDGGRWKATTDIDSFRQLYVNGVRAVRARGEIPPDIALHGQDGYRTTNAGMANWRNPCDIEFCYHVVWTHSRCKVAGIVREGDGAVITMLQPHFTMARTKEGVQVKLPSYIENAFELLDEPGEWYLDRAADTLYHIPRPGEDMATAEVIAPAVEKLVELQGTPDRPVHHIVFEGLTFADATWLRPSEIGHADVQANFLADPSRLLKRGGRSPRCTTRTSRAHRMSSATQRSRSASSDAPSPGLAAAGSTSSVAHKKT